MPCPMMGTLQCRQRGARIWIAHWNESNVCVVPPIEISNALSYVFPQHSQGFMRCGVATRAPLQRSSLVHTQR